MISVHLFFVLASFASFSGRMALAQFKPEILQQKIFKIAPHVIDTLLLLSGVALVFYGNWLERETGWIISKLIVLVVYVILGAIAMRSLGFKRWLAFAGTIGCYVEIMLMAITKQGFI